MLIDARGQRCPIPVVMVKKVIAAGETVFTVEVDDFTAVENLTRLAANQGFAVAVRALEGEVRALDFVRDGTLPVSEAPEAPMCAPGKGWALYISRDIVGAGDRELGTNLMRMFFYTLTESGDLPDCILFLNDGVKLPTLDEQVAEHLGALAEKGVDIYVCGTCLNFYGLTDRLKVGTVGNMFDIVSKMQEAGKVIAL